MPAIGWKVARKSKNVRKRETQRDRDRERETEREREREREVKCVAKVEPEMKVSPSGCVPATTRKRQRS